MSWQTEFSEQWQTFMDIIESSARREIETQGQLNAETVNNFINLELTRWSSSTQYSGAWLHKLKREQPPLGEQFETTLAKVQVQDFPPLHFEAPLVPALAVVGLTGSSFVLARLLAWPLFTQILGTAFVGLATASIAGVLLTEQRHKIVDKVAAHLRQELEDAARPLQAIAQRADSPQGDNISSSMKDGNAS